MIDSIFSTALNSIHLASQKALTRAENISKADSLETTNLVDNIIGLNEAKTQVQASAKIIKVDKEMTDYLLDIIA